MLLKGKAHYWSGPWLLNQRALKGKRTPCLKAIVGYCMHTESCPSENCKGLSTKRDAQKYQEKEQQKDLHMPQKTLCSALPGAREWKMLPQTVKALKRGKG